MNDAQWEAIEDALLTLCFMDHLGMRPDDFRKTVCVSEFAEGVGWCEEAEIR